ncbi:MAG TPA: alkaline shock response membrane anchor protein AmaP [Selenomonadales bacterium]|nr:alkaline shock response membrane anchor protein AmaP [Selenomonadales bacterium]
MGIFDRIILSIYTFLLTFLSLGVILLSLRLIPLDMVGTSLSRLYGQWEAGLVGAVFLLVSVRLLLAGLRSRRGRKTIVHHNDMGDVHIALTAVENLVEKTARHIRGVRGVKVTAIHTGAGLTVNLRAVVSPESNVPSVTAEIQSRVHEYIKNTVGIELADLGIFVENISNDFKSKHRVE